MCPRSLRLAGQSWQVWLVRASKAHMPADLQSQGGEFDCCYENLA